MRTIAFACFCICFTSINAQWQIQGQLQGGFIAPHHDLMDPLIQSHSVAGAIQLVKSVEKRSFSRAYHNPYQGIDFSYIRTGSPDYLGNQMTLSFWNKFPVYKGSKPSDLKTRKFFSLGFGIGYSDKTWDLVSNYQSPVIGSRLNAALSLAFEQQLFATEKKQFLLGLRVTHLSNGAFQLPNLGTNHIAVSLGMQNQHTKKIVEPEIVVAILPAFHHWNFSISNGWKEIMEPGGPKYPIWLASVGYDIRNKKKLGWGFSLEGIYNNSLLVLMEKRDGEKPNSAEVMQLGGGLHFIQYFGNTQIRIEQGIYLRDHWRETTPVYQRVFLRHAPRNKNYFVQIGLKTHFAKADHGEIGLGYRF